MLATSCQRSGNIMSFRTPTKKRTKKRQQKRSFSHMQQVVLQPGLKKICWLLQCSPSAVTTINSKISNEAKKSLQKLLAVDPTGFRNIKNRLQKQYLPCLKSDGLDRMHEGTSRFQSLEPSRLVENKRLNKDHFYRYRSLMTMDSTLKPGKQYPCLFANLLCIFIPRIQISDIVDILLKKSHQRNQKGTITSVIFCSHFWDHVFTKKCCAEKSKVFKQSILKILPCNCTHIRQTLREDCLEQATQELLLLRLLDSSTFLDFSRKIKKRIWCRSKLRHPTCWSTPKFGVLRTSPTQLALLRSPHDM